MTELWRVVKVEQAVGRKAANDISVVTARVKGTLLRRGDVIKGSDVNSLRQAGHDLVAVLDPEGKPTDAVWEDDAVVELGRAVAGDGCRVKYAGEGKAFLSAGRAGALRVEGERLRRVNLDTDFRIITRGDSWVNRGDLVGIVDLVPLYVTKQDMARALRAAGRGVAVNVAASRRMSAGLIVTGTEIYEHRIEDLAANIVRAKLKKYGCKLTNLVITPDEESAISRAISEMVSSHKLVIVTGGMSVDPTDVTPKAILATGAKLIMYGLPIKPTTMSLLAYLDGKPVIGLSSGIIRFADENILDVLLPHICSGGSWEREELAELGEGGIMLSFLDDVANRGTGHHGHRGS